MKLTIPIEIAACFSQAELRVLAARFIERLRVLGKLNEKGATEIAPRQGTNEAKGTRTTAKVN